MAPRGQVLPQAATDSAREARRAFFCELCQKGYARQNDFEAHEGSYDHQHRKRLKEMRMLTKDPNAAAKARAVEQKANEEAGLKSVSLSSAATTSAKKKPVFKSILQSQDLRVPLTSAHTGPRQPLGHGSGGGVANDKDFTQARPNGWYADRYQPHIVELDAMLPDGRRRPRERDYIVSVSSVHAWTGEDERQALSDLGCQQWYDVDLSGR